MAAVEVHPMGGSGENRVGPFAAISTSTGNDDTGNVSSRFLSATTRQLSRQLSTESFIPARKISSVSRADATGKLSRLSSVLNSKADAAHTFRFVYSEVVERSMRRQFRSSAFPPLTRAQRGLESQCEIPKLAEIFQDLLTVRRFRKSNVSQDRQWRAREEQQRRASTHQDAGSPRLPKLQHLKAMRMARKRSSAVPTRLPPLMQESDSNSSVTTPLSSHKST